MFESKSRVLLWLQRVQFNLISKVHYYKDREREKKRHRWRGDVDGLRIIFFRLQSFSFYGRTELVLACGPSHQSQLKLQ